MEAAVGVQLRTDLRVGLAYRFDRYRDDAQLDEPNLDGHDHSVTLSATYDFEFAGREGEPRCCACCSLLVALLLFAAADAFAKAEGVDSRAPFAPIGCG